MTALMLNPTAVAQWKALLDEAGEARDLYLDDELQSYLVFLLMRYIGAGELSGAVMALDYLRGLVELNGRAREEQLCEVGDKCLLISGLFPRRAERRRVRVSYYVELGEAAYDFLARTLRGARAALYHELSARFVSLMDLLQATRELNPEQVNLLPLEALELWQDTGSRLAWQRLRAHTDALPVMTRANYDYRPGPSRNIATAH